MKIFRNGTADSSWAHRYWRVWSHRIGNVTSGLEWGLSPWDKVALAVLASLSFCHRCPYDNFRTCQGYGGFVCSSSERWESAGPSVNISFAQQSQVCLKHRLLDFFPCIPLPTFYRQLLGSVLKPWKEAGPRVQVARLLPRGSPQLGEAWSARRALCARLPKLVPLDGNVVLLQPDSLSCKFSCFFCIYLCQSDDCTHHPGKRTEQNHFIEHYSCCAFFFSFFFPLVLCPTVQCSGLKTLFLNHSPSKNRENNLLGAISCEKSISQTIARKYCLDRYSWCNTVVLSTVILRYSTAKTAGYRSVMYDLQLTTYLTFLYPFTFSLCSPCIPCSYSI